MGKKSKKYRQKKEEREAFNDVLFPKGATPETVDLDELRERQRQLGLTEKPKCTHEGRMVKNEQEYRRWLKKASAIADFGQKYLYHSVLVTPTMVSILFLEIHGNKLPVDKQFVTIAYGSATDEVLGGDVELARFKTELAIVAGYWLEQGESAFQRARLYHEIGELESALKPRTGDKPQWLKDMDEKLETIRESENKLVLYLGTQVPCRCLGDLVKKAKEEEAKHEGTAKKAPPCDHGSPPDASENWLKKMEKKVVEYCFLAESSPRDFDKLAAFMSYYPECANDSFVKFVYACATRMVIEGRKYEFAEKMCNLALMAEKYVAHGARQVEADIQHMEETNEMEPYLRDLYINMRKTNAHDKLLRFLSHKIPCGCLDELRGITHAEGEDRKECCDICYKVCPKSKYQQCTRCQVEIYCSRECQVADYPKHKVMCKRLASALKKNTGKV